MKDGLLIQDATNAESSFEKNLYYVISTINTNLS